MVIYNNYINYNLIKGGLLIIWDIIFGTFQKETDKVHYGLVHSIDSFNPLWAQVLYYIVSS